MKKLIITAGLGILMGCASNSTPPIPGPVKTISLCDIGANELAFANETVRVRASYTAYWEGTYLKDDRCPEIKYGLDFPGKAGEDIFGDKTTDALNREIMTGWHSQLMKYDLVFEAKFVQEPGQRPAGGTLIMKRVISYQRK